MVVEVLTRASEVSDALGALVRHVGRGVVLVRGSMGSTGSGVIWNRSGLVITNHHVVPGLSAQLTVSDGRRVGARVVRRAPRLDLAALEIEHDLTDLASSVADSDGLRVGDLVIAVGNPMGERNAPSMGILASAPGDVTSRPQRNGSGAGVGIGGSGARFSGRTCAIGVRPVSLVDFTCSVTFGDSAKAPSRISFSA